MAQNKNVFKRATFQLQLQMVWMTAMAMMMTMAMAMMMDDGCWMMDDGDG